jgi:uncharacterized protein (DUF924 family)
MAQIEEILRFWFGDSPSNGQGKSRKVWFLKDPNFDQEIRTHFLADYEKAAQGQLEDWQSSPQGCLALTLLFDQFPRNLFRGQPEAFATDEKALALVRAAIAKGFDQALPPIQRWFLYIPFMHSESLADQQYSVELFRQLSAEEPEIASAYEYAIKHLQVIERFGRFPHRNSALNRATTPEEAEFLKQPGSSF